MKNNILLKIAAWIMIVTGALSLLSEITLLPVMIIGGMDSSGAGVAHPMLAMITTGLMFVLAFGSVVVGVFLLKLLQKVWLWALGLEVLYLITTELFAYSVAGKYFISVGAYIGAGILPIVLVVLLVLGATMKSAKTLETKKA